MAVKILNGVDVVGNMNITASDVPNLDANKITSGTIGSARIPNLAASKITSGTLGTARIPNLDAGKITSGTFHSDRMPDLSSTYSTVSHNHDSRYASIAHNHDGRYYTETEVDAITHQWEWRWQRWNGYVAPTADNSGDWTTYYKTYFTERTEARDVSNPLQGEGYINTIDNVDSNGGFGGSTYGNIFGNLSSYHALIYTNIYVEHEFTVNVTNFNGDDPHAIFIDGVFVHGRIPCCSDTAYNYTFTKGWHRIDLIYSEGGGGDYIRMGWNPKDYLANISDMTPHRAGENPRNILNKLNSLGTLATESFVTSRGYITGVAWNDVTGKPTLDNYGSWNLKTNSVQRTTVGSGGDLNLVAGTNVSLSYSAGGTVTISSTDTNTDTNNYLTGLSFSTSNGVLTATRQGLSDLTVDLDGRYALAAHTHSEYLTSVPAEYLTQTEGDARYLQSLPSHNHDDRYYTETEVNNLIAAHTGWQTFSDFVNGTLVRTDIDASQQNGNSFILRVVGKSYSTTHSPFDLIVQGYIYNNTFINYSGIVNSTSGVGDIKILELDGNLCFWWARFSYWNSFEIYVTKVSGGDTTPSNRVVAVEDVVEPASTLGKKVSVTPYESWTSRDFGASSVSNWNTAHSWGNHASAGYLTSVPSEYLTQTEGDARYLQSLPSHNHDGVYFKYNSTNQEGFLNLQQNPLGTTYGDTISTVPSYYFGQKAGDNDGWRLYGEAPAYNDVKMIFEIIDDIESGDTWVFRNKKTYSPFTATEPFKIQGNGNIIAAGTITASGYNKSNWDTAFGWGNHASAGYLTSVPNHSAALITSGTLDGARLSGTYNISVSGSSASSHRLNRDDNRIISPSEDSNGSMSFGFTSWTNNNTGGWADYLHLRSYTDSSGGNDNLVMFSKESIEMRIWQQQYNSSTPYDNFRDVAFKDELQTPAITSNGSTPSLNSGITASEVRSLINAEENNTTLPLSGGTITGNLQVNGYIKGNGQQLILNAGESHSYATGQTDEKVYLNAEQGLEVTTATNNWNGGWAERKISRLTGETLQIDGENLTRTNIQNFKTAYGWGNHASAGYATTAQPAPPAAASCAVVGDTIEVSFDPSPDTVDYYQIWASQDGGSYALISQVPKQDFAPLMTVVDTAFSISGTRAYRVYAVRSGVYSDPATTSRSYTQSALEPVNMNVVPMEEAFFIQWDAPASRFVDHYEVWVDTNSTQGSLSRSNATLAYSGNNTFYMHNASNNEFHQFWVEITES